MTYFKDYTKRFFFLYGKTKDEFFAPSLQIVKFEHILHNHFLKQEYKRVVFYQGTKGVYCYDKNSFDLTFNIKKDISNKPQKENKTLSKNKVLGGVLGKRLGSNKQNITSQVSQNTNTLACRNNYLLSISLFTAFWISSLKNSCLLFRNV